ncbi:MAG: CNNM domain-containing protein [Puniceicoccales bacterium]|jgi:CBS domain containing-hemolysin-like protein|nr:CNNM domain-containing protein [Puniceicoccales bacterium]
MGSFFLLLLTITLTVGISTIASLLEAILFSASDIELEDLRSKSKRAAHAMEKCKKNMDETSSAIIMLNTFSNTFGAIVAGGLVVKIYGEDKLVYFSTGLTVIILLFSEIFPKNLGLIYRKKLYIPAAYLLKFVVLMMYPFSKICRFILRLVIGKKSADAAYSDREIMLLAEKNVRDGTLSHQERKMIENTLKMDYTVIAQIMTPLDHLSTYSKNTTVRDVFIANNENIPTGRIPVYANNPENLVGIVHRRKILHAFATNGAQIQLSRIMEIPKVLSDDMFVDDALDVLLKNLTQLAFVKKGNKIVGVLTLDDIFEHIIGIEIAENDDIAVKQSVQNIAKRKVKFKRNMS